MEIETPFPNSKLTKDLFYEFAEIYRDCPVKDNSGGNKSVGMFYLWYAVRALHPTLIVESGVWKGATTWLFERACPEAKILCLDPSFQVLEYKSPKATYSNKDFGSLAWRIDGSKSVVFFDDHQNALARLVQAATAGFHHAIFDDNYPEFVGGRHLTLSACLSQQSGNGHIIPRGAKEFIQANLAEYFVFPPIFPYDQPITAEKSVIGLPPLLNAPADEALRIYESDMETYRWTTYARLRPPS